MALVLREADVRAVLTMPDTISVLEATFRAQAEGGTRHQPRRRVVLPDARGVLHMLSGFVPGIPGDPGAEGPGLVGFKAYTGLGGPVRFAVFLYSGEDGRLLAMIEADWLGRMRTGAASGVATRHMAREDAEVLCLIGTGGQAHTQALAVCTVRNVQSVLVYGPDAERRRRFSSELATALGSVSVTPVATAEEAVQQADIVVTATTAREPVLAGEWLRTGTHINAMGSNWHNRREVDELTLERCDLIVVDAIDQAQIEAGDFLIPATGGHFDMASVVELGSIVSGTVAGRPSSESVTLFKSLGIGLEDVAAAGLVYARARHRGLGEELAFLP
jgi:ornithine cyclodeaminase/alanine dehydrogenase-like protein (mu-crystallin family)